MNSSAHSAEHTNQEDFEAQCLAGIGDWVSEQLGGQVLEVTRLERWRPQWKVSYTANGLTGAVLFRGDRPIAGKNDLRFEMEVMQVLETNGIKVPHIYGWVDTPKAFVMDCLESPRSAAVSL